MEVMYCKKWWFYKKIPVDVIDEQTARQHHKSGEAYLKKKR